MNETKAACIFSSHVLFLVPRATKRICMFSHRKYLEMVGKLGWFLNILQTRVFIHGYDWMCIISLSSGCKCIYSGLRLKNLSNSLGFKTEVSIWIYNMYYLYLRTCPDRVVPGNSATRGWLAYHWWVCLESLTLTIWQSSMTSSLLHWKIIWEGQGEKENCG